MLEEIFVTLSAELEKINVDLGRLAVTMRELTDRLDVVSKQLRRNTTVRDTSFEADFRAAGESIVRLTNALEDLWKKAGEHVRGAHAANIEQGCEISIREFSSRAKETVKVIAELSSTFAYLQIQSRGLQLRLNWLALETNVEILAKLSPKILFTIRELGKVIEEASSAGRNKQDQKGN
jgi:hypothetical protein